MCSQYPNAQQTGIQVCTLFGYLHKENRCTEATSGKKHVLPAGKSEVGIAQQFSLRKYPNQMM